MFRRNPPVGRDMFSKRSERQGVVETLRTIDAEIDHHLSELSARLVREGMGPDEAAAEALRRFGSPAEIRAELLGEAAAGGSAWRNAALAAAACVLLAAVGVAGVGAVRLHAAERRIASLDDQLAVVRAQARAETPVDRLPLAQRLRFVTLEGGFARESVWAFEPRDDVTLRELVYRAGGLTGPARLSICRIEGGVVGDPVRITPEQWDDPEGPDVVLDGSYYIHAEVVSARRAPRASSAVRLASHE